MAPSQLKQLKASLRDNGILGPQKSKKQKKATQKDASKRLQRNAALEGIRERFNPFEIKAPARREKFDIASNKPTKRAIERPGVTRGLGEERRRETLLKEMQSRNKTGGMLDRRFGEDDPNMTPEQKAAERFAQQALRASKKNSMFNLEEDDGEEGGLTHGGRALDFDQAKAHRIRDDFDDAISASEASDFEDADDRPKKRAKLEDGEAASENEQEGPQRKRTKNEVMQEVIAKSKAYKAARQAQKEDDEDLRAELDKGMSDMFADLRRHKPDMIQLPSPPVTDSEPGMDPSRAAMLAGKSREEAEKEYEANVRQLKLEARSKPTFRTKPEEEKAAEEKARLEDLERKRLRRMKGEPDTSEDESEDGGAEVADEEERDDAEAFGLEQPRYMPQLEVEDEDEFVMDDILATGSEDELASDSDDDGSSTLQEPEDDGDDDFINGLVLPKPTTKPTLASATSQRPSNEKGLPFTFRCPETSVELGEETQAMPHEDLPIVVQRIRALYHKGLAKENEEKLGNFAKALIPWIASLVNTKDVSMQIIEQLIRHVHSMAKAQPLDVATGFREYLREIIEEERSFSAGDLIVLTMISTIFPTSDQWHSVVTPAQLLMARHLGQAPIADLPDLTKGIYICSLMLRYQATSGRYVPEVITFIVKAIQLLVPDQGSTYTPKETPTIQEVSRDGGISTIAVTKKAREPPASKLNFNDLRNHLVDKSSKHTGSSNNAQPNETLSSALQPESLLISLLNLIHPLITYYTTKSAFPELISPVHHLLTTRLSHPSNLALLHTTTQKAITYTTNAITTATTHSLTTRTPLLLHNHKPLAIKQAIPLFSTDYNPERKQRDPDEQRAEINKLKRENKKERKGAMRELRKDANFVAREQLREKKSKDEAYEKKFKRLVAEIQGEEGKEAKEYEKERAKRKGRF